jgi:TPP-dependent pyruvate/acetoin dehydrogenase alpha subunit
MTDQVQIPLDHIKRYDKGLLLKLFSRMVLIREFEEQVKFLFLEGTMPGTIHQCQGQEAAAVGICSALNDDDYITSTHRPHGHALAKGLSAEELMCELFGCSTGCCKGRGGSMHIGNMDKGMLPAIAIVGGGIPVAAGMGLALKMQARTQVVACFFGEGASSEGAFHEGVNLAAIWDLPVVYVCENNLYGASTHVNKVTRLKCIADKASAFGIPGITVDGNNVLAVYEAAQTAVDDCRNGKGPILLELLTYRQTGHSRRDGRHYQPQHEQQAWGQRDPIELMKPALLARDDIDAADLDAIYNDVERELAAAVKKAQQDPHPSVEELTTGVFV